MILYKIVFVLLECSRRRKDQWQVFRRQPERTPQSIEREKFSGWFKLEVANLERICNDSFHFGYDVTEIQKKLC